MRDFSASAAVLLLVAGCAAIPDDERQLMASDIDCTRAVETIAALKAARPGDARKARILASSLTPGGLALGVASNDVGDRQRVLSGRYAEEIDARIALVQETCNLPEA